MPTRCRDVLRRLTGEAGVRHLLVIGGDIDAAGPYADALAVIQKGDLRRNGIEEIGIGAYPEGHPRIPTARLEASLDEKIASATAQGLRVNIVTQFSFSGEHIIVWLKQLRGSGIKNPRRNRACRADQRAGADPLCQALRRVHLVARTGVGDGDRALSAMSDQTGSSKC